MNGLLAAIEGEDSKYGMKLSRATCEVLHNWDNDINDRFQNGERVKRMQEVGYPWCHLNAATISLCMMALRKLDVFWRHSDCPIRFKLIALDAVMRSKLLYRLDAAEIGETYMKRFTHDDNIR